MMQEYIKGESWYLISLNKVIPTKCDLEFSVNFLLDTQITNR